MYRSTAASLLAVALFAASACEFKTSSSTTGPSPVDSSIADAARALVGIWSSSAGGGSSTPAQSGSVPNPTGGCTDFQWTIGTQSANSVAGDFSAVCLDTIPVSGHATGQLTSATTVAISVAGAGQMPGLGACNFTMTSTATVQDDTLTAPFTGTSCLGPFSGTQVLRRNRPAPAEPSPTPTPAPPPPPPPPPAAGPEAWEACGALADKGALVQCVRDVIQPGGSAALAFEVTKRVAWLLRGEGAGLLIKNGGENTIGWQGYSFSVSRICYPDGHIFKVISDAGDGGTNGATWADNGFVDPGLYVPAIDPHK